MLLRTTRKFSRMRRAIAATELALLLPFLMFMWVITIDWARIYYYSITLEFSARDGAYFASNYPGIYAYNTVQEAALSEATNIKPDPTVTVGYDSSASGSFSSTTQPASGFAKVTVSYDFKTITNFPGVPSSTTLTRSCIMKICPKTPS